MSTSSILLPCDGFHNIRNKLVHTSCCTVSGCLCSPCCSCGTCKLCLPIFFGGQIALFSIRLLLDTVRLEIVTCYSSASPLHPWSLWLVNSCVVLSFLQENREPFINPVFQVSPCFFLPARVLLLALQPYCKSSMCGLFANTVCFRD